MSDIQLSVALVTRNRPDSLERTLKSLRAQNVQPSEVVISDDSDSEHATEVMALAAAYDCRYITGPRRGLYANRNHIALACRGTHIRTMDDDHEFPDDHVLHCIGACTEDPDAIWIIGEFYPGKILNDRPPDCPGQLHPRGFSVTPTNPQSSWAIADGASIYPRVLFDQGLRYIDDYKFGLAYLEFGSRLYWMGHRIRQIEATYIVHHYDPGTRSFLNLRIDLASQFCAMLCHSYIYQPALKNQILCWLEVLKQTLLHASVTPHALQDGLRGFRRQRELLMSRRADSTVLERSAF